MKNRFLNLLRKYRLLLLLNIFILIATVFSKIFGELYIIKRDFFSFNLHTVYVFAVLPIYSIIYGCLSYIICKKVWFPQMLLVVTMVLGFLLTEFLINFGNGDNGLIVAVLILIPCYTIFSISVSLITKIIYKYGPQKWGTNKK